MLENYARCTYLFQSPRSGKFVSDINYCRRNFFERGFQSPRSGKFVSDYADAIDTVLHSLAVEFQSPRSGEFVSDFQLFRLCF